MNSRLLFASFHRKNNCTHNTGNPASNFLQTLKNPSSAMSTLAAIDVDPDETLCGELNNGNTISDPLEEAAPSPLDMPSRVLTGVTRVERAWAHWKALGAPRFLVAPMVDNSELPFRMLCRKYGAEAAYTPMLHSRIFSENEKYRSMEFTTCKVQNFLMN
jgi:tRNA-dihydrouridine synthase 1